LRIDRSAFGARDEPLRHSPLLGPSPLSHSPQTRETHDRAITKGGIEETERSATGRVRRSGHGQLGRFPFTSGPSTPPADACVQHGSFPDSVMPGPSDPLVAAFGPDAVRAWPADALGGHGFAGACVAGGAAAPGAPGAPAAPGAPRGPGAPGGPGEPCGPGAPCGAVGCGAAEAAGLGAFAELLWEPPEPQPVTTSVGRLRARTARVVRLRIVSSGCLRA
jgi:hypothetical protein